MGLPPFGAFKPLCTSVPSYPICNIFFRQLARASPSTIITPNGESLADFEVVAPVGINPECGIPRWADGHIGNIANIVACGVSIFVTLYLIWRAHRRVAAVGAWPSLFGIGVFHHWCWRLMITFWRTN